MARKPIITITILTSILWLFAACAHPLEASQGINHLKSTPGSNTRSIVLIHGMWMTPKSWEPWVQYWRAKGYDVIAPAWPLHDGSIEEQRAKHPNPALGALSLPDIVSHYERIIKDLPDKPILIGHSMGGLIVQLLLAKDLGRAGVAIDSAPPYGTVDVSWSGLMSLWGVVSPFADKEEPFMPDFDDFTYGWAHSLDEQTQKEAYGFCVPESRLVGNAPTTEDAAVDFSKPRPPLLLIAGGDDNTLPGNQNWENYEAYEETPAYTAFKEFPGRVHYTVRQAGWEAVADYIAKWLETAPNAG